MSVWVGEWVSEWLSNCLSDKSFCSHNLPSAGMILLHISQKKQLENEAKHLTGNQFVQTTSRFKPFLSINQSILLVSLISYILYILYLIYSDDFVLQHCDTSAQFQFRADCSVVGVILIKQVYFGVGSVCPPNNPATCVLLTERLRLNCNRLATCATPAGIPQQCGGDTVNVQYTCIPSK